MRPFTAQDTAIATKGNDGVEVPGLAMRSPRVARRLGKNDLVRRGCANDRSRGTVAQMAPFRTSPRLAAGFAMTSVRGRAGDAPIQYLPNRVAASLYEKEDAWSIGGVPTVMLMSTLNARK